MSAQTFAVISGVAGALAVTVGAGLLIVAQRRMRERTWVWRWLFNVDLVKWLDQRRAIERSLYRHHYAFGATVIVGAIAMLATLWGVRNRPLMTSVLPAMLGAWGADSVIATSWGFAIFALGIGVILVVRPSALKRLEAAANRWIELFPPAGDRGALSTEKFIIALVLRAPRFTALALMAAGIACLLAVAALA